jgi:CRISPR-associated protein Cas2
MLILVTYDVSTVDAKGRRRLRSVAKECMNYGQRVQNSVFECYVDNSQALKLKATLIKLISGDEDSLRFYWLGNVPRTEHYGVKAKPDLENDTLIM